MWFDKLFKGLFDAEFTVPISVTDFLICVVAALVIGLVMALTYMFRSRYTKSFVITLATLPAVVCVVIMMVNNKIGTGVAVAGAFSLVRFRSIPGTAKEIGFIFIALAAGLATGMGYIAFAIVFVAIMCGVNIAYNKLGFGEKNSDGKKLLTVVLPENLDYTNLFMDVFRKYLSSLELISVKTTNMGSLYKIQYEIKLKDPRREKEFIDELRTRNGNLEITCAKATLNQELL